MRWRTVTVAATAALIIAASGCTTSWSNPVEVAPPPVKGAIYPAVRMQHIDCGGPELCLAVGGSTVPNTSALVWDGSGWRAVAPPPVELPYALDCASPTWCVVFGTDTAAVWNGNDWTTSPAAQAWPAWGVGSAGEVSCPAEGSMTTGVPKKARVCCQAGCILTVGLRGWP